MPSVPMQRVLRSDELPLPADGKGNGSLRGQATAGTIVRPVFREVEVGATTVLLTRLATGDVVAFAAHCPHQGVPLRQATIDRGFVRCEQHKYVYDPCSGRNVLPARDASPAALERLKPGYLPVYPVEERDGWVWVGTRPLPPPSDDEPLPAFPPAGTARTRSDPAKAAAAPGGPVAGEPADAPAQPPLPAPPDTVEVRCGEEFEVDLPTRPQPGHLWHVEVQGTAVEVLDERFDQQSDWPRYWIRARACAPGSVRMHCVYAKPWGGGAGDTHIVTVHVHAG